MIGKDVEGDYEYLLPRLRILERQQKFVLDGTKFAKRSRQVFLMLAEETQEEKRRYLCHGLLNIAAGGVGDDDAALLLPLVQALSLRHIIILDDLVGASYVRSAGQMSYQKTDEELQRSGVWERIRFRVGECPELASFD